MIFIEYMINDIGKSFCKNLNDRISSPFYGAFMVSWLIWNWKIWYVTFFIDSELLLKKEGILKIDYILKLYPQETLLENGFIRLIILPFLSAWFFVYIFSKVTCKFYERSLETENKNKLAKNKKDKEFLESVGEKLEVEKSILIKQAEVKEEKIKSEKSQEEKWLDEYNQFKQMNIFPSFVYIVNSIYEYSGRVEAINRAFKIPQGILVYAHTNGLVSYDKIQSRIELTEKGKFFVKQFSINK